MKTKLASASSEKPVSTQIRQEAKAPRGIISGLAPLLLCVLAFIPSASIAATNDLSGLLQKGLFEEEANRNLDAASAAYETLVKQFDQDRQIGATAVFRLGEVYRKQNKTNEAVLQYERIIRDFAEQTTLVTLSRQNLAGMGVLSIPGNGNASTGASRKGYEYIIQAGDTLSTIVSGYRAAGVEVTVDDVLKANPNLNATRLRVGQTLFVPVSGVASVGSSAARKKQKQLLEEEIKLAERNLAESKKMIEMGRASPQDLRSKELEIQLLKQQIALLDIIGSEETDGIDRTVTTDDEEKEIRRLLPMVQNSPDLINAGSKPPIFSAVEQGQLKVVKFLLDHGARVDVRPAGSPSLGRTPLLAAASTGQKAIAELLLANGADIKARDNMGLGALHLAAEKGFLTVAELLIARGAEVNAVDNDGDTPLHSAARSGQPEMESLLIKHGAEVNARDNRGRTALSLAAEGKHLEAVKVLLAAKADPNIVDQNGRTPLSYAGVNLELLRVLLTAKADPNLDTAKPPLIQAADGDNSAALALLLAQGASPEVRVGDDGVTPLLVTIRQSNTNGIAALLAAAADVNVQDRFGNSALHYVVRMGNPAVLQMLLEKGANPNVRNGQGLTPLDLTKPSGVPHVGTPQFPLVPADVKAKLAELLRAHGALDELPDFTAIRITRGTRSPYAVFEKDRNGWNHFTLFEALLGLYGKNALIMPFPDLTQIRIQRFSPTQPVERKEIVVNLLNATNGIDCAQNLTLEFGDLIEIPEREHRLSEMPVGLTDQQRAELVRCVPKQVRVIFRSEAVELSLDPDGAYLDAAIRSSPAQSVLRSSADLTRVKVTRNDPAAGQLQDFIVEVNPSPPSSLPLPAPSPVGVAAYGRARPVEGFWLQNGDVIEVPEKPE